MDLAIHAVSKACAAVGRRMTTRCAIGIDPGRIAGIAVLEERDGKVRFVDGKIVESVSVTGEWLKAAIAIVYWVEKLYGVAYATNLEPPTIAIEYPVHGPNTAGYGAQMALCAAIEALLYANGLGVALRVHPTHSKRAVGVPQVRGKRTVSQKKEPMVKMCVAMGLWPPGGGPTKKDERYALADAVAHALVLIHKSRYLVTTT